MDFGGILKKAWKVTWRYKILWLFGLLAGGAGGGGQGGSYNPGGSSRFGPQTMPPEVERFGDWIVDNLGLIIAVGGLLLLIGIAFWVISVAAKGGLIRLVEDAEEGREVRAANGWSTGFRLWGRLFLLGFVLYLPFMLVLALVLAAVFVPIVMMAESPEGAGTAFVTMCGGVVVGGLVLLVLGAVVGLLDQIASRHAVLADRPAMESIGFAFGEIKSRFKDVAVMWVVMFGVGIAFGVGVGIIAAVFGVPMALSLMAGAIPPAIALGLLAWLAIALPSAVFSAFSSAAWTIFYRRLTGREAGFVYAVPGHVPEQEGMTDAAPVYAPSAPLPPVAPAPPAPEPPAPYAPAPGDGFMPPPPGAPEWDRQPEPPSTSADE